MAESKLPTEFGIFYPTGWLVVAFADRASAARAQRDLLTGGYDEEDCKLVSASQVIPAAKEQLEGSGWLARLGMADELVERHLTAAREGNAFLVVHAPTDPEAARVMNVLRRAPFEFAHRYHRFAIETMK